jgi:hypothetical protein
VVKDFLLEPTPAMFHPVAAVQTKRLGVVYIVQAARTGDDEFSLTVDDREEALATAVAWAGK